MGVTTQVIIPAAAWDDESRLAARDWVTAWWQHRCDLVTVAELAEGPWSKGRAVNAAIAASTADVIVVADSDSFVPVRQFNRVFGAVLRGSWAAPFTTVRRLDPPSTAEVLASDPAVTERPAFRNLAQPPHRVLPGGGIVAAHRNLWSAVGGFDPRFAGWGGEDYALGCAMRTLAEAPARTAWGDLWHLWHTPQPDCRAASPATDALGWRYRTAKFKPDAMRALIGEWR